MYVIYTHIKFYTLLPPLNLFSNKKECGVHYHKSVILMIMIYDTQLMN